MTEPKSAEEAEIDRLEDIILDMREESEIE
jgi:hypothetical protein